MRYGGQLNIKRMHSPCLFIESPQDMDAIYQEFEKEYSEAYSPLAVYPEGGVDVENFVLRSTVLRPRIGLPRHPLRNNKPPQDAYKGKRDVFWGEFGAYRPTRIFEQGKLLAGNVVEGPAIIEAVGTTIVLPPERRYTVNEYLAGIIE
jgi:N-methylhydantoinase A/acetophenone carboxylase